MKNIVDFVEEMLGEGNSLPEWQKIIITKAYNNYKETGNLIIIQRGGGHPLTLTFINSLIKLYDNMKGEDQC